MKNEFSWLYPHGEMARLIKTQQWDATSLGNPTKWPSTLKASINACLASDYPAYVWWGEEFIVFYNDAYIALAGSVKHPSSLGKSAKHMWPEIWPLLQSFISEAQETLKPVWRENLLMPLERNGNKEEAYFSFSFNPLLNEEGDFSGINCICSEMTEIQQSQQSLYNYFMQAPLPLVVMEGPKHFVKIANAKYEKLIGRPAMGKEISQVFSKGEADFYLPILDQVFTTGEPYIGKESPITITDDSGTSKNLYLDFGYHPFKETDGKISGVLAMVHDVTSQVEAREKAEAKKQKFEALFVNSPAAMALLRGPEFIFEKMNDKYREMTGNRDFIDLPLVEALPELKNQPFHQIMKKVFETGETFYGNEMKVDLIQKKDRGPETVYLDFTYTRISDGRGQPYGIYIHAVDVTYRVLGRLAIEENQNRLKLALKGGNMGTWSIDLSNNSFRGDDRFSEIHGIPASRHDVQETLSKRFHPDDAESAGKNLTDAIMNLGTYSAEYRMVLPDGGYRWVYSRGEVQVDSDGKAISMSGISIDIHNKKMDEEKLRRMVAARDEFLSIASHELKTPLTSLKLQSQLHLRLINKNSPEAYSPERVNDLVFQTERQVLRLTRLVDDMLDVSRIRTGKMVIVRKPFNFCDLVSDTLKSFKEHFQNSEYEVPELETNCNPIEVTWDRMRIEQVLNNLLTNAIRYGNRKPISIKLSDQGENIQLEVIDQGIGVAPESREKIFDRFERDVNANEVSGLGLGLFIVKQIVLAHRGRIWIESNSPAGSKFIVELPKQ